MSLLQVRVEPKLKKKAIQIAKESHIDISIAVRLFLLMVCQEKGIPFAVDSTNENEKYRDYIAYLLDCIGFNEGSSISFQDVEKSIEEARLERRGKKK